MYNVYDKISYLKGLADGMELDESKSEGKLLLAMIDILDELADAIDDNFEYSENLEDYMTLLDEDLSDIEEEIYDIDYDEYMPSYEDMECNCCEEEFEEE